LALDPTIDFTPSTGFVVLCSPTTATIDPDVVRVLKKARKLIERREDWGQGDYRELVSG
jgi:hypothetical protein